MVDGAARPCPPATYATGSGLQRYSVGPCCMMHTQTVQPTSHTTTAARTWVFTAVYVHIMYLRGRTAFVGVVARACWGLLPYDCIGRLVGSQQANALRVGGEAAAPAVGTVAQAGVDGACRRAAAAGLLPS